MCLLKTFDDYIDPSGDDETRKCDAKQHRKSGSPTYRARRESVEKMPSSPAEDGKNRANLPKYNNLSFPDLSREVTKMTIAELLEALESLARTVSRVEFKTHSALAKYDVEKLMKLAEPWRVACMHQPMTEQEYESLKTLSCFFMGVKHVFFARQRLEPMKTSYDWPVNLKSRLDKAQEQVGRTVELLKTNDRFKNYDFVEVFYGQLSAVLEEINEAMRLADACLNRGYGAASCSSGIDLKQKIRGVASKRGKSNYASDSTSQPDEKRLKASQGDGKAEAASEEGLSTGGKENKENEDLNTANSGSVFMKPALQDFTVNRLKGRQAAKMDIDERLAIFEQHARIVVEHDINSRQLLREFGIERCVKMTQPKHLKNGRQEHTHAQYETFETLHKYFTAVKAVCEVQQLGENSAEWMTPRGRSRLQGLESELLKTVSFCADAQKRQANPLIASIHAKSRVALDRIHGMLHQADKKKE